MTALIIIVNVMLIIDVIVLWNRVSERLDETDDRPRFDFSPHTIGEFMNDSIRWMLTDKTKYVNDSSVGFFTPLMAVLSACVGIASLICLYMYSHCDMSIKVPIILTCIQLFIAVDSYVKFSKGVRIIFALILYLIKLLVISSYGIFVFPALFIDDLIYGRFKKSKVSKASEFIRKNITITNIMTN